MNDSSATSACGTPRQTADVSRGADVGSGLAHAAKQALAREQFSEVERLAEEALRLPRASKAIAGLLKADAEGLVSTAALGEDELVKGFEEELRELQNEANSLTTAAQLIAEGKAALAAGQHAAAVRAFEDALEWGGEYINSDCEEVAAMGLVSARRELRASVGGKIC